MSISDLTASVYKVAPKMQIISRRVTALCIIITFAHWGIRACFPLITFQQHTYDYCKFPQRRIQSGGDRDHSWYFLEHLFWTKLVPWIGSSCCCGDQITIVEHIQLLPWADTCPRSQLPPWSNSWGGWAQLVLRSRSSYQCTRGFSRALGVPCFTRRVFKPVVVCI